MRVAAGNTCTAKSPQYTQQFNTSLCYCIFLFTQFTDEVQGRTVSTYKLLQGCNPDYQNVWKMHFLLESGFPATEERTRPAGLCLSHIPGYHRWNGFSCLPVPGTDTAFLPWVHLTFPYALLWNITWKMGLGCPTQPQTLLCFHLSLLWWPPVHHQPGLPMLAPQQLVHWPVKYCQVSEWPPKKHSLQATESTVSAQDSVTWYE